MYQLPSFAVVGSELENAVCGIEVKAIRKQGPIVGALVSKLHHIVVGLTADNERIQTAQTVLLSANAIRLEIGVENAIVVDRNADMRWCKFAFNPCLRNADDSLKQCGIALKVDQLFVLVFGGTAAAALAQLNFMTILADGLHPDQATQRVTQVKCR